MISDNLILAISYHKVQLFNKQKMNVFKVKKSIKAIKYIYIML